MLLQEKLPRENGAALLALAASTRMTVQSCDGDWLLQHIAARVNLMRAAIPGWCMEPLLSRDAV